MIKLEPSVNPSGTWAVHGSMGKILEARNGNLNLHDLFQNAVLILLAL